MPISKASGSEASRPSASGSPVMKNVDAPTPRR